MYSNVEPTTYKKTTIYTNTRWRGLAVRADENQKTRWRGLVVRADENLQLILTT